MDEAYRPVVAKLVGVGGFGQQGHEGLVELAESTTAQLKELLEDGEKVLLDDAPAGPQEFRGKAIRPRRFAGREALDGVPNLLRAEWRLEGRQVGGLDDLL